MKQTASEALAETPPLIVDGVVPIPSLSLKRAEHATGFSSGDEDEDHFIQRNGIEFAGTHLILDFWGAKGLDELDRMEQAMREAVSISGATLLHIHLHHFTPNGGISGVAVLAESHISVHTWPERGYAAFDIFMCGDAEPELAIPTLKRAFTPKRMVITEHLRGIVEET